MTKMKVGIDFEFRNLLLYNILTKLQKVSEGKTVTYRI